STKCRPWRAEKGRLHQHCAEMDNRRGGERFELLLPRLPAGANVGDQRDRDEHQSGQCGCRGTDDDVEVLPFSERHRGVSAWITARLQPPDTRAERHLTTVAGHGPAAARFEWMEREFSNRATVTLAMR